MSKSRIKKRKGFSLVELVVVIGILIVLASAVFLGGATVIRQSREASARSDLRNLATYVQDAMYAVPKLQYGKEYEKGEYYYWNTKTGKYCYKDSTSDVETKDVDSLPDGAMKVRDLLNTKYLTADFQLDKTNKDPWKNPYCFSYAQAVTTAAGRKGSSCMVVINSMGANSRDETSSGVTATAGETEALAKRFASDMKDGSVTYTSATDFVEKVCTPEKLSKSDDCGVVIVMINGQVSTAYYGLSD